MKLHDFLRSDPTLEPYRKKVKPGDFLFQQGYPATSFLILTEGVVELVSKKERQYSVVNYLGAINMLGEQALVEPSVFSRVFGARALGEVSVLEFDQTAIKEMHEGSPQMLIEILEATLRISNERLNRMNRLLQNVRSANPAERFLYLLLYFSAHHGQPGPDGKAIVLNFETVNYYIDISLFQMEQMISQLEKTNLVSRKGENIFVIKNEKALLDRVPKIKDSLAPLDLF